MSYIIDIYIFYFIAAELVKGTFIGVMYGRRDYVYYNFLTNIITNYIIIAIFILAELGIIVATNEVVWLGLGTAEAIIIVIETIIYRKLFNASKLRAIGISIITNILNFIICIILILLYYEFRNFIR